MTEEDRNKISTVEEIVNNRDWYKINRKSCGRGVRCLRQTLHFGGTVVAQSCRDIWNDAGRARFCDLQIFTGNIYRVVHATDAWAFLHTAVERHQ